MEGDENKELVVENVDNAQDDINGQQILEMGDKVNNKIDR